MKTLELGKDSLREGDKKIAADVQHLCRQYQDNVRYGMSTTIPEGIVAVLGLAEYHEAGYWKVVNG